MIIVASSWTSTLFSYMDDARSNTYESPSEVNVGRVVAPAVILQHANGQIRTRSQVRRWGICGGQGDTGTCFSPSNSVFVCQYHSTDAPYPFLHVALKTMWNGTKNGVW